MTGGRAFRGSLLAEDINREPIAGTPKRQDVDTTLDGLEAGLRPAFTRSIVPFRPACVLEATPRRSLEDAPGPDTSNRSNIGHGLRTSLERDGFLDVRQ